jgi:pyruvate kinase
VLDTLAKKGRPSRAEITDAAMGVRAECVMLNKGPYILNTIRALDDILRRMQEHQNKKKSLLRKLKLAETFAAGPEPKVASKSAAPVPKEAAKAGSSESKTGGKAVAPESKSAARPVTAGSKAIAKAVTSESKPSGRVPVVESKPLVKLNTGDPKPMASTAAPASPAKP